MSDQNKSAKFAMPKLDTSKLQNAAQISQLTTREEQEQYHIGGVQDGKTQEFEEYERNKGQRKMLQKNKGNRGKINEESEAAEGGAIVANGDGKKPEDNEINDIDVSASNDSEADKQIKQTQQDKKKKRKQRKKKANQQAKVEEELKQQQQPKDEKNFDRFKHNIMASHDLYNDSNDDSEDEGIKEYQVGGYHPVHLGEVLIQRYVIVQKLGWGQFSTVWLAKDMKHENTYVALKVQKSAPSYKVAAYDEVEILDVIAKNIENPEWHKSLDEYHKGKEESCGKLNGNFTSLHTQVVQLLNSFMHYGANGDHFIMVFEILGVNLLEIMKRYDYKGIPMPLVRRMSKQVLIGLDYLHRVCKIIHTDLKPENTIVALGNEKLVDIIKTGKVGSSQNKSKMMVDSDNRQFIPDSGHKYKPMQQDGDTLLSNVDTDGLTKQQKKKLKKKIKNERKKDDDDDKQDDDDKSPGLMDKRTENIMSKLMEMNETEEDLVFQRPRSHSFPNLQYIDLDSIGNEENIPEHLKVSPYVFKQERSFQAEIQEYIILRRQMKRKIEQLKNGEVEEEPGQKPKTREDPEQEALAKKQGVDYKGPLIDEDINCKICDLGNGCWTHYHFVPKIQTRQYRAPEVILGIDYDASTDLWSYACMVFELITGDFLFNPRPGQEYKKNDDHLALFIEMLGPMPKKFAMQGNMFDHYFKQNPATGKYLFRRIQDLKQVGIREILIYRHHIKPAEADVLADFLSKILKWYPKDRPTSEEMLKHPWFTMADNYEYKMNEMEYKLFELKDQAQQIDVNEPSYATLMEKRANLMNNGQAQRIPMDFDEVEFMKAKKQQGSGLLLYQYPGELAESDEEYNGGDVEDYISEQPIEKLSQFRLDSESELSWTNSDNSDYSFDSDKLIDGYKDFVISNQKQEVKQAEEEKLKEKGGPEYALAQKSKKDKKKKKNSKKQDDNPFAAGTASSHHSDLNSSITLSAVFDCCENKLIDPTVKFFREKDEEFDLNISFSGGYVPNTDCMRVDKGQGNPQFGIDHK